jgi:hypothetical protein
LSRPPRESFPRTASLDVGAAVVRALARLVEGAELRPQAAGGARRFSKVTTEWASFNDRLALPAAAVVAPSEMAYGDALLTPSLLRDTWWPEGRAGWGLYLESEMEQDLGVVVRCATKAERSAAVSAVEDLFTTPSSPRSMQRAVMAALPEYWGLSAVLSLKSKLVDDDPDKAAQNRWEAAFTVQARAQKVKLDVVNPFLLTIRENVD